MNVTLVAPCGPVDPARLDDGARLLQRLGFAVKVHPQCRAQGKYMAGSDTLRLSAFLEAGRDETCDIIWCVRGGYGALRLLPALEEVSMRPGKTLVGYSDVSILHHFVAHRWGWQTLHGPMPITKQPALESDWQATAALLLRGTPPLAQRLQWLTPPPATAIEAPLVGGNLSVWNYLTGTPWQPAPKGQILFFEDVREANYDIDRMLTQLRLAGGFDGVLAIVLGTFSEGPEPEEFAELFGDLGVPVARGVSTGHAQECAPLMLNVPHRLSPDGSFEQVSEQVS